MALCAWVSAQGPAPLPAEIQVKQFKTNRILIENLVDHGIDLSNADDPLERAKACRQTARTLANYLERAADAEDAERIAEFATLYGEVVRDGLVPILESARTIIPNGSPRWSELQETSRKAAADFAEARKCIPTAGKAGESEKVKAVLAILAEMQAKFAP